MFSKNLKILMIFLISLINFHFFYSFPPLPMEIEGKIVCNENLTGLPLTVKVKGSSINKTFLIGNGNKFYIYINPEDESFDNEPLEFYLFNIKLNYSPILYFQSQKKINNYSMNLLPSCIYYLNKLQSNGTISEEKNLTKENENVTEAINSVNNTTNANNIVNKDETTTVKTNVEKTDTNKNNKIDVNSINTSSNSLKDRTSVSQKKDDYSLILSKASNQSKLIILNKNLNFEIYSMPNNSYRSLNIKNVENSLISFYNSLGIKVSEEQIKLEPIKIKTKVYKVTLSNNKSYYMIERDTNSSIVEIFKKEFIENSSLIYVVNGKYNVVKDDPILIFAPENGSYSYIIKKDFNNSDLIKLLKNDVVTLSVEMKNNLAKNNKTFNNSFSNENKTKSIETENEKSFFIPLIITLLVFLTLLFLSYKKFKK